MTRLNFRLPEWDPRVTWTSAKARSVWEPRMRQVSQAYVQAEREAVVREVKASALQSVSPDELLDLTKQMAAHGIVVLPLGKSARATGYTSATQPLQAGAPFDYRVAITRPRHVEAWTTAWATSDNEAIGTLLGYPPCCRAFFERAWVKEHWFDPTYPMAEGGLTDVRGTNMLLRWFGVRPVSHLPCSFECEPTKTQAVAMLGLLPQAERDWAIEMLAWPALWSSLHGVAEIFTPVFRAVVPTDALASKAEVRYQGTWYPTEGATGTTFPYRRSASPIPIARPALKNGFLTDEAMHAAHAVLLQALEGALYATVLDLGCGNGELLCKIPATRRIGVEVDVRTRTTGLDRTVYMDCTDRMLVDRLLVEERPDLVIAQRDRNPPEQFSGCDVLSYSYEGVPTATLIRR